LFDVRIIEVRPNVRQVEIHLILLRGLIDPIHIIDALRLNQRADRPTPIQLGANVPVPIDGGPVRHLLNDVSELLRQPLRQHQVLPRVAWLDALRELAKSARLKPLIVPKDAPPEKGYRPSVALADFVRFRDLTCRFPGCDCPAEFCDIDHTIPYDVSRLTHPSNLKCVCRKHHLLKTFWNGEHGWRDRQLPDGTVIWTAPTGQRYTTYPASLHLFPSLCEPTATLWTGDAPVAELSGERGVMMPRRRHTRAHTAAKAIAAERRLNDPYVAERNKPPPF